MHDSDPQVMIEEHYTDTSGFTDNVFAMMHLLGFRFAPRIRDLSDKRLFVPRRPSSYPPAKRPGRGASRNRPDRAHPLHLERAVQALADGGQTIDETLLHHLSPLGWEHINLTGDYVWAAEQADRKSSISGPCAEGQTLSVLYNPNSLVTPTHGAGAAGLTREGAARGAHAIFAVEGREFRRHRVRHNSGARVNCHERFGVNSGSEITI